MPTAVTTASADEPVPAVVQGMEVKMEPCISSSRVSEKPSFNIVLPITPSQIKQGPSLPVSKTKEKSNTKNDKYNTKHKRSRRRRNTHEFDPDKHCGVLDASKRPCLRAITCANHTVSYTRPRFYMQH